MPWFYNNYEMKRLVSQLLAVALGTAFFAFALAAATPACDPDNGGITLPAGFCALVVADGVGTARHMAVAPNGDVYVAIRGRTANDGGVVALRDTNGDGRFEVKETFGDKSTTGIALRNGYLYVAHVNSVERYKMTPGQLKPAGEAEVVVSDLQGVRQHGDKGITFDGKGSLYVNVGAPSNACQARDRQKDSAGQDPCPILEEHGGIWKFDENKLGQKQDDGTRFATGLRQMPAIAWHDGALYIVMNNRDQLDVLWSGALHSGGERRRVRPSRCTAPCRGRTSAGRIASTITARRSCFSNPEYGGDGKTSGRCSEFTLPIAAFPAHWAPVDLMFYSGKQFPAALPRRRVHRVPWIVESRAHAAGRLQHHVPAVLGQQAVGRFRSVRQRLPGQVAADEPERRRRAAGWRGARPRRFALHQRQPEGQDLAGDLPRYEVSSFEGGEGANE